MNRNQTAFGRCSIREPCPGLRQGDQGIVLGQVLDRCDVRAVLVPARFPMHGHGDVVPEGAMLESPGADIRSVESHQVQ